MDGLAHPLPQIALDPLATQDNGQEKKHRNDAETEGEVAISDKILGSHTIYGQQSRSATPRPTAKILEEKPIAEFAAVG
jgi:hypothetical protein